MAVELNERHKIDFANRSHRGVRRQENNDGFGKFPDANSDLSLPKGQLFLIADAKTANPVGGDAAKMAIRIIQENYFTYPSNDITFSLQRAFDIANRQLYQYAKANGLQRRFGATCSALVLTERYAYVAHVGDCRIFRIGPQKIERLTKDHTRILNPLSENKTPHLHPEALKKSRLTRALGVKLGIKVDVKPHLTVTSDEYFLLCTDGLENITNAEIQQIVLALPPREACNKLIEISRERGSDDDTTVQIVKYSYQAPEEPLESFSQTAAGKSGIDFNWPVYGILVAILLAVIFLVYQPFREQLTLSFGGSSTESSILAVGNNENSAAVMEDQQLLQAAEHLKLKRLDKALQIYQAVLQNNSRHVEAMEGITLVAGAYREQGERAYRRQKWKEARRYFQKSLTLCPGDSELSLRIRECSRFLKRKKSTAPATGKSDETDSGNDENAPPRAELLVEEFNSSRWQTLGLYEHEDYRLQPASLTFFNNLKIKKFFHRQQYEAVEMSVMAKALSVGNNARYGVIFAHNTENTPEYQNFYLFTIDNAEHFALQKVVGTHVKTIVSEVIKPGIIGSSGQVYLRLKALDNFVLLYANGELLKMVSIDEPVKGGVGLYVDPKLRVEFSKIKISPAEY